MRDHFEMWRKAAAAAREMLKQAAADEWGVPVDTVDTEPGVVVHRSTGRKLAYGRLVTAPRPFPVPQSPKLKTPDKFRYIGKNLHRLDSPKSHRARHLRRGRAGAGHAGGLHRAAPGCVRRQGAEL